jgi:hypothetical protein
MPKPVKDGNKFINKMEEKNLSPNVKLIESKEMTEKIKSFNNNNNNNQIEKKDKDKELESVDVKSLTANNKQINYDDDEFNH